MLVDTINMLSGVLHTYFFNEGTLRWDFKIYNVICMFMDEYVFPVYYFILSFDLF